MEKIKMPKYEHILQYKKGLLSGEEKLWYDLLCMTSDIVRNAMIEYIDGFTGNYQQFRLSDFFTNLNGVLTAYSDGNCKNKFLIDEFVQVAYLAEKALKYIVNKPSTKIIKVDAKVQANKLKNSSLKTMSYLAKRSGQTIKEKIAPDNKVLTTLTRFSVDTAENRQSMYLFDSLYNVLECKFENSPCKNCKRKERECCKVADKIRGLLHLKNEIRKSELSEVRKEKQRIQNNKLMCDKYYKLVWDSTKLLDSVENKLIGIWQFLKERYDTLVLWFVIAKMMSYSNVKIVDRIEGINDKDDISFEGSQNITLIVDEVSQIKELTFEKQKTKYVCKCAAYRINSPDKPQTQTKKIPMSDILEEFFKA